MKSRNLRILVVDDSKEICNVLDMFLSMMGHLIMTANNVKDAIMLAENKDYDLVLSNLAMPDGNGYDVLRALNDLEKSPKIGVITGWEEKLNLLEKEDLKVDFVATRPFNFSELAKNINRVVNE